MWIEIESVNDERLPQIVTPRAGVWIEIRRKNEALAAVIVTPRAGVWIEIISGLLSSHT